jgi:anti-sigma-K factor RskA
VDTSAEKILDIREQELRGFSGRHIPVNFGEFTAVKNLVTGVRRAGSFKRYVREPHREFLALRGLAMRGHLAPRGTRRTRGTENWKAAVAFLARHGDNGVVWNVLSFWRATK